MKKKKKRIWLLLPLAVILAAGLAVFVQAGKKTGAGAAAQLPVTEVKKGDIAQELDASGVVTSEQKKTYYSPVNAPVQKLNAEAGDSVKKGQKLVVFDLKNLQKENRQSELNTRSGEYDYENTKNKADRAKQKQTQAQANAARLERDVAAWKQYVEDLKDEIAEISAQESAAAQKRQQEAAEASRRWEQEFQKQYEKDLEEYQTETMPEYQSRLDEALAEKNRATAAYNTAQTQYQLAFERWNADQNDETEAAVAEKDAARSQAQILSETANRAYETLQANPPSAPQKGAAAANAADLGGGVPEEDLGAVTGGSLTLQRELEEASQTLAELQSELASERAAAENDLGTMTAEERAKLDITKDLGELEGKTADELLAEGEKGILAEFDGVVSEVAAAEGAAAAQGMQLLTVQSTEKVSVDIAVSKYDFDKLSEGQKAKIALGRNTYDGTVSKVSRIAVPNEKGAATVAAKVHIDNPDENIFLGVDAKVTIAAAQKQGVLLVPNTVINIGKDGSFCYVIANGVIEKRMIETGLKSDTESEIVSGLKEGDEVILDIGTYAEGDAAEGMAPSDDAEKGAGE